MALLIIDFLTAKVQMRLEAKKAGRSFADFRGISEPTVSSLGRRKSQ